MNFCEKYQKMYLFMMLMLVFSLGIGHVTCQSQSVVLSAPAESTSQAASLAFVFDITGSMFDDLVQVIQGAARILKTTLARQVKPLHNYVLVPFHDPDIGPVLVTTDPDEFQRELKDLYVQGGGDCPEMTIGAIKEALDVSLPNSFIYVFTDARAKDYYLTEEVLALIQQKQSQVVFVLTGDCGDQTHIGYRVFEQIASTSSGQVFLLEKHQVNQVLNFVRLAVNARKVNLMSLDKEEGGWEQIRLPIDSKLREFTVSVSGESPNIRLFNPLGKEITRYDGLRRLLNLRKAKVVSFKKPVAGVWTVEIESSSPHTLRVTGLSTVDFVAGFSQQPETHIRDTFLRPLGGVSTNMLINVTDLDRPGKFEKVELLDLGGRILAEYSLTEDPYRSNMYTVGSFIPPEEFFYIKISGTDAEGYQIQRTTPTAIKPRPPAPPHVFMPQITRGFYDSTARIVCSVNSEIPYNVQWYRDGVERGRKSYFDDPANVTLEVPFANTFSEGIYMCNATNMAGSRIGQTFLDISEPPPTLYPPQNASVLPGDDAVLTCAAFSTVDYNITWYRRNPEERIRSNQKYTVFNNGSLLIRRTNVADGGEYICRAANEGGHTDAIASLNLQVKPVVYIEPQEANFINGGTINLTCHAKGNPPPDVYWIQRGEVIIPNERILIDRNKISMSNLLRADEGEYGCLAENKAGNTVAVAVLHYIEAPRIVLYEERVLVASGDTAKLTCAATGIPEPQITWYRGDTQLTSLSYVVISDTGISIIGTQEQDAGDYRCMATNEAGSDSAIINLEVGSEPIITQEPYNVASDIGTNATLRCVATGIPPPKIYWKTQDGSHITTGGRFTQLPSGALFVQNLKSEDRGRYTCVVQNQFGVVESSAFLTITGIVPPVIAAASPFIVVDEGDNVDLSCVVLDGKPTPSVSWLKNGRVLSETSHIIRQSQGMVRISDIQETHEGEYTCLASNVGGNATYIVNIDVQVKPKHVIEDEEDTKKNFTIREGNGVILPCRVSGDPPPEITWYKDGSPLSPIDTHYFILDDGRLEIFSAEAADSGNYRCVATNIAGSIDKNIQLFVEVPPSIDGEPNEQYTITENTTVTLPCIVNGQPMPAVTWRKNFVPFEPSESKYVFSDLGLTIREAKVSDKAFYECVATNVAGSATKVITLVVQIAPVISPEGARDITLHVGETAILNCETSGDPKPTVLWKKDNVILDNTGDEVFEVTEGGSLKIVGARLEDDGSYVCKATNPAGSAEKNFYLTVHEPPYMPDNLPNSANITEGDVVILPCPATGTPKPDILWYKDETEITGEELGVNILEDGSLQIENSEADDSGRYKCEATNIAGTITRTVDLKILVPPKIIGDDTPGRPLAKKVVVNDSIILTCPVEADPPPQIEWFKNGGPLPQDDRLLVSDDGKHLTITRADVSDTARYKCRAKNVAGETDKAFDLDVYVPPTVETTTVSPDKMNVTVGNPLYINCPVTGIPQPEIIWLKDGDVISTELDPNYEILANGRRLKVIVARVTDAGRYTCIGENVAGRTNHTFDIDVHVPPNVEKPGEITATEVKTENILRLSCPASGIPRPEIKWFKNTQAITANTTRYFLLDDGWTLVIKNAQQEDTARFTCRAKNVAGQNEKIFNVNVLASGIPRPEIKWFKNTQAITANTTRYFLLDDGWTLVIKNAQQEDTARFTCRAKNVAGKNEKIFNVNVLVPAQILRENLNTNHTVVLNGNLQMNCPVEGIPSPSIVWYKNGVKLNPTIHKRYELTSGGRVLRLHSAQLADTAVFNCEATNKAGTDNQDFNVHVYVPSSIDTVGINTNPKITVDNTLTIDCPATGIPPPVIQWFRNGQLITLDNMPNVRFKANGRQMEIVNAKISDTGRYTCQARNDAGISKLNFDVEVQVPPKIANNTETDPKVVLGEAATIICPALGTPEPDIIWLKNDQPIDFDVESNLERRQNGKELYIRQADVSDTGVYTCIAKNEAGEVKKDFNLDVWEIPHIDENGFTKLTKVNKGRTTILNCPASGIPKPDILWLKNGQPLGADSRLQISLDGRELKIVNTTETDSGTYTCQATNSAGGDEVNMELSVLVPPSIDESNVVYNPRVIMDRDVILECPVSGIPTPIVEWLINGQPLQSTERVYAENNNRQLVIHQAQVGDTAAYTCIATNEAGALRKIFNLEVLVPAEIRREGLVTELTVKQNGTITIYCPVTGIPQPSILWSRGDDDIPLIDLEYDFVNLRVYDNDQKLEISNAQVEDAGKYTCTATNVGRDEVHFNLRVFVPPIIDRHHAIDEFIVIEGDLVELICPVVGIPEPLITWKKDGLILNLDTHPHIAIEPDAQVLKILGAKVNDTSRYTCHAENQAGFSERFFDVEVRVPPRLIGSRLRKKSVVINQQLTLECPSVGIPPPKLTWERRRQTIPEYGTPSVRLLDKGRQLVLINAQLIDAGSYKCIISNPAGDTSLEYIVDVLVPPIIEETGLTRVTGLVNTRALLSCNTDGLPNPVVTWEKDGTPFPTHGLRHHMHSRGSIEFSSVRLEDAGNYLCIATNTAGNTTRAITLDVQVRPSVIGSSNIQMNVVQGADVTLPCNVQGEPFPRISWQKGATLITGNADDDREISSKYQLFSNGSLLVLNTENRDSGRYVCVAQNNVGYAVVYVNLMVEIPPQIISRKTDFVIPEGRNATLPCRATGRPSPSMSWYKEGQLITRSFYYSIDRYGSLNIPVLRPADSGVYRCVAMNNAGNDSIDLHLTVQVPASILEGPRLLTNRVGEVGQIPCHAVGNPRPNIVWRKDGRIIASNGKYRIETNGTLSIHNLQPDDTGSYYCTATNVIGRKTVERTLRIQVPPRIILQPVNQFVIVNSKINMSCAAEGIPTPLITWTRNEIPVPVSSVDGHSSLIIRNALREDAGLYTCTATNPAGIAEASATVLMKVPPRVTVPDGDTVVSIAEKVILTCSVGGDPLPEITWTKNGRTVEYNERIQLLSNGSLVIYHSTSADAGLYKCLASNDAGTDIGVAMLTVHEPPIFKIEPKNTKLHLGETVTMNCIAEGEPQPDITWMRDWTEIIPEGRISVLSNNSLRILAAQLTDSGLYRCKASNRLGITIVEANLTVVVDGRYSQWSEWDICSSTCGIGVQFRTRSCTDPAPANGGRKCIGSSIDSKSCVVGECPVDGEWGNWLPWEHCSVSCGRGEMTRHRLCDNPMPRFDGRYCHGDDTETQECESVPCPIHGNWGDWSSWGLCSVTCGDGLQERYRDCDNPPVSYGGQDCVGSATETKPCTAQLCAVNGNWGRWSQWTGCTLSCGGGSRKRTRSCDSPSPQYGGLYCGGRNIQVDYCNPEPCPVHGNWSPWGHWGDCSVSCNSGLQKRFRTCTNPAPSQNGRYCVGPSEDTTSCNTEACPVNGEWDDWSAWSECSKTCDLGYRERSRTCNIALYGGQPCVGDSAQLDECYLQPCSKVPRRAEGNLVGYINNIDITEGKIRATMMPTEDGLRTKINASVINIPTEISEHFQHLISVLNPVYWTTAQEINGANNGYSLNEGEFTRDMQVEFATGEILKISHYSKGVDGNGILQLDTIVRGNVPDLPPGSRIKVYPYSENYIQTGSGSIYAHSSRMFRANRHPFPYAWNHSVTYDEKYGLMPFLVQNLETRNIHTEIDPTKTQIRYVLEASISPGSPSNKCPKGFDLDPEGQFCRDEDECSTRQPCSHYCHNSPGGYSCSCSPGHLLDRDGSTCLDIDECQRNHGNCPEDRECINLPGSFQCAVICSQGFKRSLNGQVCEDIDECHVTPEVCGQFCQNVPGSYVCSCSEGFKLLSNGRCTDVNECRRGIHGCSHLCRNSIGSYKCACPEGYTLVNGNTCRDIDECAEGGARCGTDQECVNTQGSYRCIQLCPLGYERIAEGECADINECTSNRHRCYSNQKCINTDGGYECQCPVGYRTRGPGEPCLDINECLEVPGLCIYRCKNTEGDFECICPFGQTRLADKKSCAGLEYIEPSQVLAPNSVQSDRDSTEIKNPLCYYGYCGKGKGHIRKPRQVSCPPGSAYSDTDHKCIDIDECLEDVGICQHNCTNTVGSFVCSCPPGYKLSRNKRKCIDINECQDGTVDCGPDRMCFNTRGDYSCIDIPCPTDYKRDPLTNYCVLECIDTTLPCPANATYADIIEFRTLALPSGILAYQDLIQLTAYNQDNVKLEKTLFSIIKNDPKNEFELRLEDGTGILYTLKPLEDKQVYQITVRARSYDSEREHLQYQTTFIIYISVSAYPY